MCTSQYGAKGSASSERFVIYQHFTEHSSWKVRDIILVVFFTPVILFKLKQKVLSFLYLNMKFVRDNYRLFWVILKYTCNKVRCPRLLVAIYMYLNLL